MDKKYKITSPLLGKSDLVSFFHWMNFIRVIAVLIIILAIGFLWLIDGLNFNPRPVWVILSFYCLLVTIFWYLSKKRKQSFLFLYLQNVFDVLMITLGIYFAGGIHSDFVPLYVLTIITSAFLSLWAFLGTTLLVAFCYVSLILLTYLGLVPPLDSFNVNSDTSRILVFLLMFVTIAFQSRYYASRIRKKDEELLKLKDEFLFTTVHDLRSPITVIKWALEKYNKPQFIEKHKVISKDIVLVENLVKRMLNSVNKLMRLASGEYKEESEPRQALNITSVISELLEEQRLFFSKKKIKRDYFPQKNLPLVFANKTRLKEIFTNLLNNAVKYNKEGGTVKITHQIKGNFLETIIEDTGIGIASENLPKLFSPYFRGKITKEIQGTGLGLYITKKIVKKLGGSIEAASIAGEGSTFKVLLPLAK